MTEWGSDELHRRFIMTDGTTKMQQDNQTVEVKLCKDCRWSKDGFLSIIFLSVMKCHHPIVGPKPEKINLVTGQTEKANFWSCDANRMFSGDCGREGKFWETK